jgi:hypothetical protein
MEFTAPQTPQENGKVERAFATLWGRAKAMLNSAAFDEEHRHGFFMDRMCKVLHNVKQYIESGK